MKSSKVQTLHGADSLPRKYHLAVLCLLLVLCASLVGVLAFVWDASQTFTWVLVFCAIFLLGRAARHASKLLEEVK